MAGKRNSGRKVPATNLKDAVSKLLGELGVESVPAGWFSLHDLMNQSGLPEMRIRRKMKAQGVPEKRFRVKVHGCIRSLVHYKIPK